jgi:hypothetical protein
MTTIRGLAPALPTTTADAPAAPGPRTDGTDPPDRPSRLIRLLELAGPGLASVAMVFGAPIGSYSLAATLHRDARRPR